MSDLFRPPPPPTWRDRVSAVLGAPGALRPARVITAAGALLLVASAAWWLLRTPAPPVEANLPRAAAAAPSSPSAPSAPSSAAGAGAVATTSTVAGAPSTVVVQAAGAVARPGVYRLAAGSRVHDLLAEAGGPAPGADLDVVPLAGVLADGERVYVPLEGEAVPPLVGASVSSGASPPGTGGTGGGAGPPALVDLNLATAAELDELPGVGPATAAAIVAHRAEHGPFQVVEELLDVRGIGPSRLEELRPLVKV